MSGMIPGAAVGGAYRFLASYTPAAVASFDIEDFSADFDQYRIVFEDLDPVSNGYALRAQFKMDGAYVAVGSYRYVTSQMNSSAAGGYPQAWSAGEAGIRATPQSLGNGIYGAAVIIDLFRVNDAVRPTLLMSECVFVLAGVLHRAHSGGFYSAAPASHVLQGIRFAMVSGNINNAVARIYGLAKE